MTDQTVDGDTDYDGEPDVENDGELPAVTDPARVPADQGDGGPQS